MKISTKVALVTSSLLTFMVIMIVTVVIYGINAKSEEDFDTYKQETMAQTESYLKDLVDVAYETIDINYRNLQDKGFLEKYYGHRLRNVIDATESILQRKLDLVRDGQLTLKEARAQALAAIKRIRYDGGTGYVWVNDTGKPYPKMLMHPTIPALDGQILDDSKYNTAMGVKKNLFQAFQEVCEQYGEGFVDYVWPKPTSEGLVPDVEKLSYVRLFKEWGWIIGTGIYIDDATENILDKIKNDIKGMRYAGGTGYFWINDTGRPYPRMVMHPTIPSLDGQMLNNSKYNTAMGKRQNLFLAFLEVTKSAGKGYVDYLWPKPTPEGLTEEQPKLSYVRLYEPLGWVIGTGIYIDKIDAAIERKREEVDAQIEAMVMKIVGIAAVIILGAIILTILFANTFSKPIVHLAELAGEISRGNKMEEEIPGSDRKDEIGTLVAALNRLRVSVKLLMARLPT